MKTTGLIQGKREGVAAGEEASGVLDWAEGPLKGGKRAPEALSRRMPMAHEKLCFRNITGAQGVEWH